MDERELLNTIKTSKFTSNQCRKSLNCGAAKETNTLSTLMSNSPTTHAYDATAVYMADTRRSIIYRPR
jgi:hypothetical protein